MIHKKMKENNTVARSAYGEKRARPLSKAEQREEQNRKTCLNCTKPKCEGWCEKIKGSKA